MEQKRKGRDKTKHLKGMALDVYSALAHSDHYSTAEAILRINNWQKSNITSSVDVEVILFFYNFKNLTSGLVINKTIISDVSFSSSSY